MDALNTEIEIRRHVCFLLLRRIGRCNHLHVCCLCHTDRCNGYLLRSHHALAYQSRRGGIFGASYIVSAVVNMRTMLIKKYRIATCKAEAKGESSSIAIAAVPLSSAMQQTTTYCLLQNQSFI